MNNIAISIASLALVLATSTASAAGDPDEGKKIYRKCQACHMVGEKASNRVGPALNGILGSVAGKVEGFKYSKALHAQAEDGLVWDEESLTAFLAKPKKFMPGTKMSFKGLRKDADLGNVIAYLATFK